MDDNVFSSIRFIHILVNNSLLEYAHPHQSEHITIKKKFFIHYFFLFSWSNMKTSGNKTAQFVPLYEGISLSFILHPCLADSIRTYFQGKYIVLNSGNDLPKNKDFIQVNNRSETSMQGIPARLWSD